LKKLIIAVAVLFAIFLAGCATDTYNLTVQVQDESGNPISNAQVNVYANYNLSAFDSITWNNVNGSLESSTQTNEKGIAQMSLIASKYAVNAYKSGYTSNGTEVLMDGDKTVTVKLSKIQIETLTETLDGETYTVTQNYTQEPSKYGEWQFYAANSTQSDGIKFFADNGDDAVYLTMPGNKIPIFEVKQGELTILLNDSSKMTFRDNEEYQPGYIARVGTNGNTLKYFRIERRQ